MIECCLTLQECESILSGKMSMVKYIGQVELSRDDLAVLDKLICSYICSYSDVEGLENAANFLRNSAPVSTALYFVYQGVWKYSEGNYWPLLPEKLHMNEPSKQAQWGNWFLDFIKENNLTQINTEGTYHYVTPILVHGGISQNLLDKFFEKVVVALVDKGLIGEEEIKDFLDGYRVWEQEEREKERQISELDKKKQCIEKEKQHWHSLIGYINQARELKTRIGDFASECPRPKNLREIYNGNNLRLNCQDREIKELEDDRIMHLEKIRAFSDKERRILGLEPEITELKP